MDGKGRDPNWLTCRTAEWLHGEAEEISTLFQEDINDTFKITNSFDDVGSMSQSELTKIY